MTPEREYELRQMVQDEIDGNDQSIGELLEALRLEREEHGQTLNRLALLQFKVGSEAHVDSLAINEVLRDHATAVHNARRQLNSGTLNPSLDWAVASNLMSTFSSLERVLKESK